MFALIGIVVGTMVILAACVSVRTRPKRYSTCKILRVQKQAETGRNLWAAYVKPETGAFMWLMFHSEIKPGWVVQYVAFHEEGDPVTHASVHAIFSVDDSAS
jgi:hypothetical protein